MGEYNSHLHGKELEREALLRIFNDDEDKLEETVDISLLAGDEEVARLRTGATIICVGDCFLLHGTPDQILVTEDLVKHGATNLVAA